MSQRTIRIASVANQLFLKERRRVAIKWLEKKKHLKVIEEIAPKLGTYLQNSQKIDFIKSKLDLVSSIDSLNKALDELKTNLENIAEQSTTAENDMQPKLNWIKKLKGAIMGMKKLLDKKDQKEFAVTIATALSGGRTYNGSIIAGTSEPLDEDDNTVEDGVTSEPLEDREEELN